MSDYLVVMTNAKPGHDEEFNAWYDRHLNDILALDGFESASRLALVPEGLTQPSQYRFMALYKAEDGRREVADASLAEARVRRNDDGSPFIELSEYLEDERTMWWFSDIEPS